MKLEHRNLLCDLIPKLFERRNFENLIKRVGQPDVLDDVPGDASFNEATCFIVDRAISGGWGPALVTAIREEFPARPELAGLDVSTPPSDPKPEHRDKPERRDDTPVVAPWWKKPAVLPAGVGVLGIGITLLVLKMCSSGGSEAPADAAVVATTSDAPPRPPPPPPPRTDAGAVAPPRDARIVLPIRDGGIRPFPIDPHRIDPHHVLEPTVIAKLKQGQSFPIGKCNAATWTGPKKVGTVNIVYASCTCANSTKTGPFEVARYTDEAHLPAAVQVTLKLKSIGARCAD